MKKIIMPSIKTFCLHTIFIGSIALTPLMSLGFPSFNFGHQKAPEITTNLGFVTVNNLPVGTGFINPIRAQAIRETAFTLGAQGALAWRSLQINNTLVKQ